MPALSRPRARDEKNVAADEVKEGAQHGERKQGEQIGIWAIEEWIVSHLPFLNSLSHSGKRAYQFLCRDHNSRDCATGDITGRKQYAGALVAFSSKLRLGKISVAKFYPQITIDEQANHSANEDWT